MLSAAAMSVAESERPNAAKPLLRVLAGECLRVPPVWLMRQAGRYLPEYREARAKVDGFLNFCLTPGLATEVTLQPIRRFGFDAAIVFSDILVIPHALGHTVRFVEGAGPRLAPLADAAALDAVRREADQAILAPVYETVQRVKTQLPSDVALIGFCGAPWTVAVYMVAGSGTCGDGPAKLLATQEPNAFGRMIDKLVEASAHHLVNQLDAGADCVQIFDSWSGALAAHEFEQWCAQPTKRLVAKVRARHPGAKIIGFPRGAGNQIPRYIKETGIDAVGLDSSIDRRFAARSVQSLIPVQGNLDPKVLLTGGRALDVATDEVMAAFSSSPFIFNLGHGILPRTPTEHVERMLARVRRDRSP